MAFHQFQQLPLELRLQIWEFAVDQALFIDGLTDEQKRVCRMVTPQAPPEGPGLPTKLITFEDASLAHVCHESRQVLRRGRGRLYNVRDCIPSTDVLYIDNLDSFVMVPPSLRLKVRHIALPVGLCHKMLWMNLMSPHALNPMSDDALEQLGCPRRSAYNSRDFHIERRFIALACFPELENITIVVPPLKKGRPCYADHFLTTMRPCSLRVFSYSDIQEIEIRGRDTNTIGFRYKSAGLTPRLLGPFIKVANDKFVLIISFPVPCPVMFWGIPRNHHLRIRRS